MKLNKLKGILKIIIKIKLPESTTLQGFTRKLAKQTRKTS